MFTKVFALRLKYIARKFENTPDFSEYMQQREERLVGATQESDIDKAEREVEMKEKEWGQTSQCKSESRRCGVINLPQRRLEVTSVHKILLLSPVDLQGQRTNAPGSGAAASRKSKVESLKLNLRPAVEKL